MSDNNSQIIDISIIVPAYNESKRLPFFLSFLITFCKENPKKYEIIIVDDASGDDTYEKVTTFQSEFSELHLIKLNKHMGKGYAVKCGFFSSKGKIALFLDADGSVAPNEIEKNLHYFNEGHEIIIGSRVLKSKEKIVKAKIYRKIIGICFNYLVHTFLFKEIKDTQCGFKMFRRDIIKPLFSRTYINGFGFDIELLYLANKMGYKIKEVPISWEHKKGGKVNLLIDSLKMFLNILQIRNWHCTPINPRNKYLGPNEYNFMYNMENTHWWFVSKRKLVNHLLGGFNRNSSLILDVGCGTGSNIMFLRKFGKCFGIDVSDKALTFCKKNGLKTILQCDAERISFKKQSFEVITCLDLLEHADNIFNVLNEFKRIIKDEGKIIITVPAIRLLWSQHDDALCHMRRFGKKEFIDIITESNFKIDKIGYFFFSSFFIVAPIRIIRRFFAKKTKIQSDTTTLPPYIINEFLKWLFSVEIKISSLLPLPIGTTLFAVISKK